MVKYKELLVLYNSGLDFIPYFEKEGIKVNQTYKKSFLPSRVFRRIFESLNFSQSYWYADWKKDLPFLKTVIVFADLHFEVLKFIKKCNKDIRIIYWYWDPVFRLGPPKQWMNNIAEIWSFDPSDCVNYCFKFNTTFYFSSISLPKKNIEFDVFFIGNDKGRVKYLQDLQTRFTKMGIKGYYHIIPDKSEDEKKKYKQIPYSEYLNIASKTRVLIDILPFGQSGLTIRAMESIFFNKKLITNDNSIETQDFYTSENIFIVGKDSEEGLIKFINSPYIHIQESIVKQYEVTNWIERFNI